MIIKPKYTDYEHPSEDMDDFVDVKPDKKPEEEKPKKPVLTPDDPQYWEEPEDEFEHLKPRNMKRWIPWVIAAGVAIGLIWALYIRIFTTYSDGAIQYGYVEQIDHRGEIFKTFEGTLLPYKSITDTVKPYEGDFVFSVADDHLAAELRRLMLANLPARVEYSRYRVAMPWRGESRIVITRVDTANPAKILPPGIPHPTIPARTQPEN